MSIHTMKNSRFCLNANKQMHIDKLSKRIKSICAGFPNIIPFVAYEPRREKTNVLHICENKDADQLRGNREADQRLCFHYIDSTIPLLSKSEISSL